MNEEHKKWIAVITFYLEKLDVGLLKKVFPIVKRLSNLEAEKEKSV